MRRLNGEVGKYTDADLKRLVSLASSIEVRILQFEFPAHEP